MPNAAPVQQREIANQYVDPPVNMTGPRPPKSQKLHSPNLQITNDWLDCIAGFILNPATHSPGWAALALPEILDVLCRKQIMPSYCLNGFRSNTITFDSRNAKNSCIAATGCSAPTETQAALHGKFRVRFLKCFLKQVPYFIYCQPELASAI